MPRCCWNGLRQPWRRPGSRERTEAVAVPEDTAESVLDETVETMDSVPMMKNA